MILTDIVDLGTPLFAFWRSLEALIPGLRGRTQHYSIPDGDTLAVRWARQTADQLTNAYGRTATDEIGRRIAPLWKNYIESGFRWGGTGQTQAIVGYFTQFEEYYGNGGTYGNNNDMLFHALYGHARWILGNMDVESTTEFPQDIQADYKNILFPLMQQSGLDISKISFAGAGGEVKAEPTAINQAAFFLTENKTIIMIVVALVVLAILYRVFVK
jgi:hypothetical protein